MDYWYQLNKGQGVYQMNDRTLSKIWRLSGRFCGVSPRTGTPRRFQADKKDVPAGTSSLVSSNGWCHNGEPANMNVASFGTPALVNAQLLVVGLFNGPIVRLGQ